MKKIAVICAGLLMLSGCHFLRDDSQYKVVNEHEVPQKQVEVKKVEPNYPYADLCNYPTHLYVRPVVQQPVYQMPQPQMQVVQPVMQQQKPCKARMQKPCGCANKKVYSPNYNLNCNCQMADGSVQMVSVPVQK